MRGRGVTRRRFLRVVGTGGAAAVATGCGEEPLDFTPKVGRWDVGVPSDYEEGDLRFFPDPPVLVGRDADGFYAMSALCTHRACVIGDEADEIAPGFPDIQCSCHLSTFTKNGEVLEGPAARDLQHYELSEDAEGRLVCDTGVEVEADERLVPG
jgi:Rieske Fe-S protein